MIRRSFAGTASGETQLRPRILKNENVFRKLVERAAFRPKPRERAARISVSGGCMFRFFAGRLFHQRAASRPAVLKGNHAGRAETPKRQGENAGAAIGSFPGAQTAGRRREREGGRVPSTTLSQRASQAASYWTTRTPGNTRPRRRRGTLTRRADGRTACGSDLRGRSDSRPCDSRDTPRSHAGRNASPGAPPFSSRASCPPCAATGPRA